MTLELSSPSLILLIGPSGAGKSTFARQHFRPTQVLSSDFCRGLVSDDENDQSVSRDAFEILHLIAAKRLRAGRLTVIDATNVQPEARRSLLALAREHGAPAVALVLDLPVEECVAQNLSRPDRVVDTEVVRAQAAHLRASLPGLSAEGFARIYTIQSRQELDETTVKLF